MPANRISIMAPMFIGMLMLLSSGCRTSDGRIREIVREEMTSAMKRSTIAGNVVGPYSPAQKIGGFLFTSGQIGLNQQTGNLEDASFESEARQAFENLRAILRNAGYDSSQVVYTTVYLTDIENYGTMNALYGRYFQEGTFPARTTVQVSALPRHAHIEVAAIAYQPQ